MKKIYLLFLFVPLLSCANETQLNTPEEFGNEVFRLMIEGNRDELLGLIITKVQFDELIDSFDAPSDLKDSYKSILTNEILEEVKENVTSGFNSYKEILTENNTSKSTVEKISDRTSIMKTIPFQMGTIEIEFRVATKNYLLSIESIKSLEGWRIMDDFHVSILE